MYAAHISPNPEIAWITVLGSWPYYSEQEATRNKCIASSNKCLTSSNKKLRTGLLASLRTERSLRSDVFCVTCPLLFGRDRSSDPRTLEGPVSVWQRIDCAGRCFCCADVAFRFRKPRLWMFLHCRLLSVAVASTIRQAFPLQSLRRAP